MEQAETQLNSRSKTGLTGAPAVELTDVETTLTENLRHLFVRSQMTDFIKDPLVMAKAEGIYYWDVHGKKYLDALSGIYTASLGHAHPRILKAIAEQMEQLHFSPVMHGTNPVAVRLAKRIIELAPDDLWAVKLLSGGSEATEAAFKMARQYHKLTGNATKYKIIARYQSWHGSTYGSLSASGLTSRRTQSEPLTQGFVHVFPPTCYRCPFGKEYPTCELTCATLIEDVIRGEGPETVAAIIVEPIGHTGGIIDPPDEYLPLIREICDRHNILLIFDEVITGTGRTGELFAAETFGVTPDLLCLGKGMSGGYVPLSALISRKHVAEAFWGDASENPGFVEGHTFEGNPVSAACGLAVLDEIVSNDLCGNAREMGARLKAGLENLRQYGIIGDIRGKGLFVGVEYVRDIATKEQFDVPIGTLIGKRCLHNGLLTRFDPHWMAFGPALNVTAEQIDEILRLFEQSMIEELATVKR